MDSAQDDKETILATSSESEDGIRNRHTDTKKDRKTKKRSRDMIRSRSRSEKKVKRINSTDSRSSSGLYKRPGQRPEKYHKFKDKKDRRHGRDDDRYNRQDKDKYDNKYTERYRKSNSKEKKYKKRSRSKSKGKVKIRSRSRSKTRSRERERNRERGTDRNRGNTYDSSKRHHNEFRKSKSREIDKGTISLEIRKKFEEIAKRADGQAPISTSDPSKRDREIYIMNLPEGLSPADVTELINSAMVAIGANIKSGNPVLSAWINSSDLNYAFLQFRTPEEATNAFKLDGISLLGKEIKVGRPRYQDDLTAKNIKDMFPTLTSFERDLNNPYLNRNNILTGSAVSKTTSLMPSSTCATSKLLVSNLPLNFNEDAVYKFMRTFGKIKSLEMIKDPITGNYSGQCHIEYETETATASALHYVMGINLQGNILYIKRSSGLVPIYSISSAGNSSLGILTSGNFMGSTLTSADEYTKFKETTPSKVICIKNMCTLKELEDDDEYEDLYDDVMEECKCYAKIICVRIPRPEGHEAVPGLGKVFVECYTREGAAFAKEHLNGKSFHGRIVEVVYHPEDMFRKNQLD